MNQLNFRKRKGLKALRWTKWFAKAKYVVRMEEYLLVMDPCICSEFYCRLDSLLFVHIMCVCVCEDVDNGQTMHHASLDSLMHVEWTEKVFHVVSSRIIA